MQSAISRAKAFQEIKINNEKLRKQTWIELIPIKKLITDKKWFGKVISYPSPKMIELIAERDEKLTNAGYYDIYYNVQI